MKCFKHFLSICFLLIVSLGKAQEPSQVKSLLLEASPIPRFSVYLNVGQTLLMRPTLSLEFQIKESKNLEFFLGGIFANEFMQKATVKTTQDDYFKGKGASFGIGLKNYVRRGDGIYSEYVLGAKYQAYDKEKFNNGFGSSSVEGWEYITTASKLQSSLSIRYGKIRFLNKNFVADYYAGLGILYQDRKRELETMVYDNSYRYYGQTLPINENRTSLYPLLLLGIKLGYKVK